jgi:DNA processing protein
MAALDYNRDVYAIPGPIDSTSSEGTNWLIQQGAKLVTTGDDILDETNIDKKNSEIAVKKHYELTSEEKIIIEKVEDFISADDLVHASGMNVAKVSYILTMLEMKGILENIGGMWKKKI